jgi:hypothetical protein
MVAYSDAMKTVMVEHQPQQRTGMADTARQGPRVKRLKKRSSRQEASEEQEPLCRA